MTIYALDLGQVHETIRDTLINRVLPAVESSDARSELLAVLEMLENLESRLSWNPETLTDSMARTSGLAGALGLTPPAADTASTDDVEALRANRRLIGDTLADAYADGIDSDIVSAVTEFTTTDVKAEISRALAPGLPD